MVYSWLEIHDESLLSPLILEMHLTVQPDTTIVDKNMYP